MFSDFKPLQKQDRQKKAEIIIPGWKLRHKLSKLQAVFDGFRDLTPKILPKQNLKGYPADGLRLSPKLKKNVVNQKNNRHVQKLKKRFYVTYRSNIDLNQCWEIFNKQVPLASIQNDLFRRKHQTYFPKTYFLVDLKLNLVGGIPTPLKHMSLSVGMMTFPIYGKSFKIPWFQSPPTSHYSYLRLINHSYCSYVNPNLAMLISFYMLFPNEITIIFPLLLVYSLLTPINHHY